MKITELYVDRCVEAHPLVGRFSTTLGLAPVVIAGPNHLYDRLKQQPDPWGAGKQRLLLTRNQGSFLRQCPGTRDYICCDYKILNIGSYCTMDCSYCILQSYFHPPVLQYFVNHDDLFQEIDRTLARPVTMRMGTGEFTDSLIWEDWSPLTPTLIERFAKQKHAILELKTKTTAIRHLEGLTHKGKTILAWSLNTPQVIAGQERGTSALKARLRAAAQCREWGYPLAFHFDPMVLYPGWEADYEHVVRSMFDSISADAIVWISMGALRYMPALQPIIQQRFPRSTIIHGEFVPGIDGKMRYFKPLRIRAYRLMAQWIRQHAPEVTLYLCMEDEQVWRQGLGVSPQDQGGLPAMLDRSARVHCGLDPSSLPADS